MWYHKTGHVTPIRPKRAFDAMSIQDAIRYMQQGQHLGKIAIVMRGVDGNANIDVATVKSTKRFKLDSAASYLLVGGLGGLGRAIARHLVEHNARRLVFLSRHAGISPGDPDIIMELESMGCEVHLVQGSVVCQDDVIRALKLAPNLKGVLQCSMVLRDENFSRMSLDEWAAAVEPKVQGTWNLHNATVAAGIQLDFFVLFSSVSGLFGQAGQANYAGANTFLNAFVQYRTSLGLAASSLNIGPVLDAGYVSQDESRLKKLIMETVHGVTEPELMKAVTAAILFGSKASTNSDTLVEPFVDTRTVALGLSTIVPLSSPESRAFWRKDRRMAIYHNTFEVGLDVMSFNNNRLKSFLAKTKNDPSILKSSETTTFFAKEIGSTLFNFLLKSDEELITSVPLSQLGMDSLVGVEMRSWWRQAFGFDISMLELLGMGTLDGLGKHAAKGLLKALQE